MKRVLGIAAGIALLISAGAAQAADSASSAITIQGVAENVCNIPTAPGTGTPSNITVGASTAATTALTITDFINDTTAVANSASITLTFANAMCNYAHNLGLKTTNGGLTQQAGGSTAVGGSGTFLSRVDYTASASFGGVTTSNLVTAGTAAASVSSGVSGANLGDLVVTFSIAAGAVPVLQGTYQDTLTVKIGAAI